ncbi:MAG TPA: YkuS family protein [Spirochaetia bacterium]|nr:YkuS family protein [Spirochaetia bacterium]
MAGKTVALDLTNLHSYRETLTGHGYRVVPLTSLDGADAAVIAGMDRDLLGHQDIVFPGPVIDASGMTAAQVVNELDQRLR